MQESLQGKHTPQVIMVLVGNKCDMEKDRVISQIEAAALISGQPAEDFIKTSAKIFIIEIFVRLFPSW